MTTYKIIVTDVTCYGDLYCVAGWDLDRGKMIRPEPSTAIANVEASRFWKAEWAGPGKAFAVGNVVQFDAGDARNDFPFPHATEDRVVDAAKAPEVRNRLSEAEVHHVVVAGLANSLNAAFGSVLVRTPSGTAHVPSGNKGPSLGAVDLMPTQVVFYEDSYKDKTKLRASINDGHASYNLPVPADAARSRWQKSGLKGLRSDLASCTRVHLRVGLSRPMSTMPDRCYCQVNGLYFL